VVKTFDVAVVGGGITGMAIAQKLSARGLRVGLMDSSDIGTETSASSHRIIHGGFRYLSKFDFPRVRESIGNLDYCLAHFGDCIEQLPCYMPLKKWGLKSRIPLQCAGILYQLLRIGSKLSFEGVRVVDGVEVPPIFSSSPFGTLRWVDGWLRDHVGVVQSLAREITAMSGTILQQCKISEIRREGAFFVLQSADQIFNARSVVTALGPWAVVGPLASFKNTPLTLAYNIVLSRSLQDQAYPNVYGAAQESPSGRLFFLVPRADGTAIGTGYFKITDASDFVEPSVQEIEKFLIESRGLFNWPSISLEEIVRIEWGVLPVRSIGLQGPTFYGSSIIKESEVGRFDVLSTKYTSFESTARNVEVAVLRCLC